jgi:hypothetical protein
VQAIDLYDFFTAQFFINLLQARRDATLRGARTGFPTKLSTVFVGDTADAVATRQGNCL